MNVSIVEKKNTLTLIIYFEEQEKQQDGKLITEYVFARDTIH